MTFTKGNGKSMNAVTNENNHKRKNPFKVLIKHFFPQKKDTAKEKIRKTVVLCAFVLFIGTSSFLLVNYVSVRSDKVNNDKFREYYHSYDNNNTNNNGTVSPNGKTSDIPIDTNDEEVIEFYEQNPEALHNFAKLLELNSDTIGWIKIGETGIDYPVFKSYDNYFYLSHNSMKEYSRFGSVFADWRTRIEKDDSSDVTILYAHNMESTGEYFEKLTNYSPWETGLDYYKQTPVVDYDTLFEQSKWKIFGAVYCSIDSYYGETFNYLDKIDFSDESDFYQYISEVMDRSLFYTDVDVRYDDKFLVLSTCYFPIDRRVNGRFLVYARKVRENESETVDTEKAVINPSPRLFKYFYETQGGEWSGGSWDHSKVEGYDKWLKSQESDQSENNDDKQSE